MRIANRANENDPNIGNVDGVGNYSVIIKIVGEIIKSSVNTRIQQLYTIIQIM